MVNSINTCNNSLMKKGTYVVMTKSHITGCGKQYERGHIGILCEDITIGCTHAVYIRFPRHSTNDSSWIPVNKFVEAADQQKAETLFEKGVKECTNILYK